MGRQGDFPLSLGCQAGYRLACCGGLCAGGGGASLAALATRLKQVTPPPSRGTPIYPPSPPQRPGGLTFHSESSRQALVFLSLRRRSEQQQQHHGRTSSSSEKRARRAASPSSGGDTASHFPPLRSPPKSKEAEGAVRDGGAGGGELFRREFNRRSGGAGAPARPQGCLQIHQIRPHAKGQAGRVAGEGKKKTTKSLKAEEGTSERDCRKGRAGGGRRGTGDEIKMDLIQQPRERKCRRRRCPFPPSKLLSLGFNLNTKSRAKSPAAGPGARGDRGGGELGCPPVARRFGAWQGAAAAARCLLLALGRGGEGKVIKPGRLSPSLSGLLYILGQGG